jgi:hypothetical protein
VTYNATYASGVYGRNLSNLYDGLPENQTNQMFVKSATIRGSENYNAPGHFRNEMFGIAATVRYQNNRNLVYGNKFNDTTS